MAKRLSCQLLAITFPTFVRFRENKPTKNYSCKILDGNSNSKCHFLTDYEMVALNPPPPLYCFSGFVPSKLHHNNFYFLIIFLWGGGSSTLFKGLTFNIQKPARTLC